MISAPSEPRDGFGFGANLAIPANSILVLPAEGCEMVGRSWKFVQPGHDMSNRTFSGKRALVTGGNRGLGLGIARCLAAHGAEVCLVAHDEEALAAARREIEREGAPCHAVATDLATTDGVMAAADEALSISPRWDILVNSAGNPPGPTLLEMEVEYWDKTFAVHCRAPFLLAQAVAPGMIQCGGGDILNISSTASLVACRGHGAYSSAKTALNMLTRSMALEWGPHNIRVNAICPTAVMTEMGREVWGNHPAQARWLKSKIPIGRFAEVADVVALAEFLLGPENSFITGAIIPVDGGLISSLADGPPIDG